jgi:hypothetical protein
LNGAVSLSEVKNLLFDVTSGLPTIQPEPENTIFFQSACGPITRSLLDRSDGAPADFKLTLD